MIQCTPVKNILIICSFEKEHGSGHLIRSCITAKKLRMQDVNAFVVIPSLGTNQGRLLNEASDVFTRCCNVEDGECDLTDILILDKEKITKQKPDLIIFDLFKTSTETFYFYRKLAPILAIDEGGPHRKDMDWLLDLLPVYSKIKPNSLKSDLITLPKNRSKERFLFSDTVVAKRVSQIKILICFGSEDSAELGSACVGAINTSQKDLCNITYVSGMLNNGVASIGSIGSISSSCIDGITTVPFIENLREHLADYDLLITHFGLTAFEAIYAGVSVILVSPTAIHENTAKHAGFISMGIGAKSAFKLWRGVFDNSNGTYTLNYNFLNKVSVQCHNIAKKYNLENEQKETLDAYIKSLQPSVSQNCPICGYAHFSDSAANSVAYKQNSLPAIKARFDSRSYILCPVCGMYYLHTTKETEVIYDDPEYFFSEYKKQYGKTYLEDFENILRMAKKRFVYIKKLTNTIYNSKQKLLDIGCAYGAFLYAAEAESFIPTGIDISGSAVDYVCNKLNIKALKYDFEKDNILLNETYKVVTMWYVIEHFENLKSVLLKIKTILQEGGILAFSTPNSKGISAKKSTNKFLEQSPCDHKTILSPAKIKKLLKCFDFNVAQIVITGHHPERFPLIGKYLTNKESKRYKFIYAISRIFKLGDTFEVYAVKT
ncbi:hypothetical protein FACS1894102_1080 [Spirochaetia bacterium]|nr:hypothetical protein FACS1894102_1080 [Spirochaetia bacterium]